MNRIDIATTAGCVLAGVGVIAGIVRVAGRRVAECPDGKTWSSDEKDFICYVHPHAFEGAELIIVASMLGILIGLVGYVARTAVLRDRAASDQSASRD